MNDIQVPQDERGEGRQLVNWWGASRRWAASARSLPPPGPTVEPCS